MSLLKRTPVLDDPTFGPYDPARYVQERGWATAADGTRVPLSIVRRADVPLDGSAPAVLYGYGSYEASMDPGFSISRLSLLDRGIVYAVAHVRGGGELGRGWYEQGKMLSKINTFTDFVACADYLVTAGYTSPDRLAARGGSAGGLLMGAVANLAPDRFRAIHAAVPFVDPLTSILDPDLPLTVVEWEEWGNPLADPEVYAYMKSYSPYENVGRPGLPGHPRHHQPERHPGALRRAGQVGRCAAPRRRRTRRPRGPAEDRDVGRPRRRERSLPGLAGARVRVRVDYFRDQRRYVSITRSRVWAARRICGAPGFRILHSRSQGLFRGLPESFSAPGAFSS